MKKILIALIFMIVVIIGTVVNAYTYNDAYVDVSGKTVKEVAQSEGKTLDEFLLEYDLPQDMPGDVSETEAYYTIPCWKIAEMYGISFEELKASLQLPDEITYSTAWGDAEGEVLLKVYVGEENLDTFRQIYGLEDTITGNTKWKEIRNIVDQKHQKQRIAIENYELQYQVQISDDITLYLNNEDVTAIAQPLIVDDFTLVPIRFVAETMGFDVIWDNETSGVTISKDDICFTMFKDSNSAYDRYGNVIKLNSSLRIINDKSMVPLRFLSEQMGLNISWDNDTRSVFVN